VSRMQLCGTLTAPCWWCARSKAAVEDLRHRPLFTEVPRIGILRTSPFGDSQKFASSLRDLYDAVAQGEHERLQLGVHF
jgi:hypothetical protein